MKQLIVLFIVLFSVSNSAFAQKFTAKLSSPEIRIGEQATIEFQCSFSAAEKQIMLPALKDTISKFKAACIRYNFSAEQILPHDSYLINLGHPETEALQKSRNAFFGGKC